MITLKPVKVNARRIGIVGWRVAVENYGTVSLENMANMMKVNNTVTYADVVAVMNAYYAIVQQDILRGYSVDFCGLITFTPRVSSRGTQTKAAWEKKPFPKDNIKKFYITAAMGGLKKKFHKGAPGVNMRMTANLPAPDPAATA